MVLSLGDAVKVHRSGFRHGWRFAHVIALGPPVIVRYVDNGQQGSVADDELESRDDDTR